MLMRWVPPSTSIDNSVRPNIPVLLAGAAAGTAGAGAGACWAIWSGGLRGEFGFEGARRLTSQHPANLQR